MIKPDGKNLEELIENKFYCARKFTEEIEKIAQQNKDMSYVDAIVFFCENFRKKSEKREDDMKLQIESTETKSVSNEIHRKINTLFIFHFFH